MLWSDVTQFWQVEEGRQWRAAMQGALSHWSLRLLYACYAQWLLYAQVMTAPHVASCHPLQARGKDFMA